MELVEDDDWEAELVEVDDWEAERGMGWDGSVYSSSMDCHLSAGTSRDSKEMMTCLRPTLAPPDKTFLLQVPRVEDPGARSFRSV